MAVRVPTGAAGGDDVLEPLQGLLRGVSVLPSTTDLGKNNAAAAFTGTPESVSIIEAGATALSKGYAALIAALGGAAAVASAVTDFWDGERTGVRIALTAGTAVVLAAALVAVAVIVSADVRGRADGAVAQYAARRHITVSMLELSLAARAAAAAGSEGTQGTGGTAPATGAARAAAGTDWSQVIWTLALASWPADVVQRSTGMAATLSGIRPGADGRPQVRITRRTDGADEWCRPEDLELRENTFGA